MAAHDGGRPRQVLLYKIIHPHFGVFVCHSGLTSCSGKSHLALTLKRLPAPARSYCSVVRNAAPHVPLPHRSMAAVLSTKQPSGGAHTATKLFIQRTLFILRRPKHLLHIPVRTGGIFYFPWHRHQGPYARKQTKLDP